MFMTRVLRFKVFLIKRLRKECFSVNGKKNVLKGFGFFHKRLYPCLSFERRGRKEDFLFSGLCFQKYAKARHSEKAALRDRRCCKKPKFFL